MAPITLLLLGSRTEGGWSAPSFLCDLSVLRARSVFSARPACDSPRSPVGSLKPLLVPFRGAMFEPALRLR